MSMDDKRAEPDDTRANATSATVADGARRAPVKTTADTLPTRSLDVEPIHAPPEEGGELPARVGPYLVEERIGRGGMGEVLAVRDYRFDRQFALKRLHPFPTTELSRELFISEMKVTASLDHPHIVPVVDRGTDEDGRPWFVMPRLRGRPLSEVLTEEPEGGDGAHTLTDLLQIFLKVAAALGHAHARGVLHLDIKPANVVVGKVGDVYLVDWGIARARVAHGAADDVRLGTPRYMAPEQLNAALEPIDERTDIFGLGALLFAVATRRPPPKHTGDLREGLAHARVPSRLAAIIAKATAPVPEDRYGTVEELVVDVQAFFSAEPYVMLIHRTIKPGCEEAFERWAADFGRAATGAEGHLALTHLRLPGGQGDDAPTCYLMVARFSSEEHAARFDASELRSTFLARAVAEGFTASVERIDARGHEAWFNLANPSR